MRSRRRAADRANQPVRKRGRVLALAILAIALLSIADHLGWLLVPADDDLNRYHQSQVRVLAAIDGDTIEVALADPHADRSSTRVRLWGIDCPETAREQRRAEPWSGEAAALTSTLTKGALVTLLLEPHRTRGRYGRLLCHVQLPDGGLLNERLLEHGLAVTDERWAHAHLDDYARAETNGRRMSRGLWSSSEPAAGQ